MTRSFSHRDGKYHAGQDNGQLSEASVDTTTIAAAGFGSLADASGSSLDSASGLRLVVDGTADHVINSSGASAVTFTVSGLSAGESATVTFADALDHQVVANISGSGSYTANLSSLTDGAVSSILSTTSSFGAHTAIGNPVSLDTDKDVQPVVSVDASNPADVTFKISGLEGDEHGTITFTDSTGHQDIVNVGSNGSYSADLANLKTGTISYLLSETDPAGNTVTVDPPITLGDGSANAPAGTPQFANLFQGYAVRPDWKVAGVDYYVGTPSGTVLKDPSTISMAGVSVDTSSHTITVSNSNVTLDGYNFGLSGGWQVDVVNGANNVTIQNSYFKVGANDLMPIQAYYGGTINVLNNTFDGGGSSGSDVNAMVFTGTGGATIEYNRFTNFPDDGIDITHDGNYVVQYNVFDTMGVGSFHTDAIQTYFSGISSLSIQYNTVYQPPSVSNDGINSFVRIGDEQGNVVHNPVAAYNTIIMASTNAEAANVFQWDSSGGTAVLVNPQIHDNYIDPTGVLYAVVSPVLQNPGGIINPVTYNNVDLTTGTPLLSGPYNSTTANIPSNPPAAPVITGETPVSATQVKLTGAAGAGTTVDVYDQGSLLGTVTAGSGGTWSYTTTQLTTGDHSFTARATDSLTNSSALSNALDVTVTSSGTTGGTASPPAAPVIASFSPDTGVVGDGITDVNTLTLTGTAVPNSTVKVYDGSTQIGTATASSTGSWDYITGILTDAKHMLTATASNTSGTSAASAALTVTVDTHVPAAPVLVSDPIVNTNHVQLSGTAEANSTIKVYDGTTVVGTGTTSSTGSWSVTTSALSSGTHSLTATATDVAGTVSAVSQPLDPVIPAPPPTAPAAPTIVSFSPDTGVVGDHITDHNSLMLTGTAVANSTVTVFDGTAQIGTATVNGSGQWTLPTSVLSDGTHSLTATDTDSSGHTSAASAAFSVTIDTHVPAAPTMAVYSQVGSAVGSTTTVSDLVLKGTAEANSTIDIFDGGKQIGTASTSSAGAWSFDTGSLANGSHSFTATAIDVAGTSSPASAADVVSVTTPSPPTPASKPIEFTDVTYSPWNHTATITGTADANSQIKLYDGTVSLGTVTASANGTWSLTNSHLSNTLHTIKAQEVDSGHVVETSSGAVILGASNTSTFKGTGGDDFMYSSSSYVNDTFVFASNFGHSTIEGFTASGSGHDTVQFSKSVFDSFASVLSHASQVGQDVVISSGGDTLTLTNTKLSALNSHDFHFA